MVHEQASITGSGAVCNAAPSLVQAPGDQLENRSTAPLSVDRLFHHAHGGSCAAILNNTHAAKDPQPPYSLESVEVFVARRGCHIVRSAHAIRQCPSAPRAAHSWPSEDVTSQASVNCRTGYQFQRQYFERRQGDGPWMCRIEDDRRFAGIGTPRTVSNELTCSTRWQFKLALKVDHRLLGVIVRIAQRDDGFAGRP